MNIDIGIADNSRQQVISELNGALSDTYTLYLKTQNYHWNVEGPLFNTLHAMFEEQYTELAGAVDELAERIRSLGAYAPGNFEQFRENRRIDGAEETPPEAMQMVKNLAGDHMSVSKALRESIKVAEDAGDTGTADMLTARLEVHEKTAWMLRSMAK